MEFIALHEVPSFKKECAEVLNEEWKRSLTARLHSLEKSRDSFPVCLVLLEKLDNGEQFVVGHSMLSVVRGQSLPSCLVESVVVRKSHRGKGYGRIIMKKTEDFAASKGYKVMYLTTHDKQKFYEHLGYQYCSPIVTFSTDIIPEHLANKLIGNLGTPSRNADKTQHCDNLPENKQALTNVEHNCKTTNKVNTSKSDCDTKIINSGLSPDSTTTNISDCALVHQTAKLEIQPQETRGPQPPPPPPPPVVTPIATKSTSVIGGDKVTRWDPALVSWMKKAIV